MSENQWQQPFFFFFFPKPKKNRRPRGKERSDAAAKIEDSPPARVPQETGKPGGFYSAASLRFDFNKLKNSKKVRKKIAQKGKSLCFNTM